MSSATTGGRSALRPSRIDLGSGRGGAPRFGQETTYDSSEILRMWRGDVLPAAAQARFDERAASGPVDENQRMHHLIEAEIIPRLLLAHQQHARGKRSAVHYRGGIDATQVESFSSLLLEVDDRDACAFVERLLEQGYGENVVFLELFAPAARLLGFMWECDTMSFSDVTIGLLRLHGMLRKLSAQKDIPGYRERPDMRILLSAYPGETHVFGVRMVAEFFRHAGWVVSDELQQSAHAFAERVSSEWFSVIGLSLGSDAPVSDIAALVRRLREASCNRHAAVMIGGDLCNRQPELARLVGADLTARDGLGALAEAERWCESVSVPYSMNAT